MQKIYSLKEFEELVFQTDCSKTSVRPECVKRTKYSIVKSKQVVKRKVELLETDNGVPYENITKGISKQVPDTNGITKLLVDYFRYVHGSKSIRRISSEGKFRSGKWIPSSNKGMSDIEGVVNGIFLSLELKVGKDTQRDSQKKRQVEVQNDGGVYILLKWTTFEDAQKQILSYI